MKDEMETNLSCDFISRANAIEAIASAEPKDNEYHYYKHIAIKILSQIPSIDNAIVKAMKDCRNCASGKYNDHFDTWFCYNNCECNDWDLWTPIEPIQGEWIKNVDGNGWDDWYVLKCPFCGATIEDKHYRSWKYNFCPHCGNRVKGDNS